MYTYKTEILKVGTKFWSDKTKARDAFIITYEHINGKSIIIVGNK